MLQRSVWTLRRTFPQFALTTFPVLQIGKWHPLQGSLHHQLDQWVSNQGTFVPRKAVCGDHGALRRPNVLRKHHCLLRWIYTSLSSLGILSLIPCRCGQLRISSVLNMLSLETGNLSKDHTRSGCMYSSDVKALTVKTDVLPRPFGSFGIDGR